MFTTIAWAADGSYPANNALIATKHLARATGARMLVLHVQELGITRHGLLVDSNDHLLVGLGHIVEQLREEGIAAELVTGRTAAGDAARVILELAEETGVDLLVVGNRGHGPIANLLVGSVAQRLVHHAPFPVLMVPFGRQLAETRQPEADGAALDAHAQL